MAKNNKLAFVAAPGKSATQQSGDLYKGYRSKKKLVEKTKPKREYKKRTAAGAVATMAGRALVDAMKNGGMSRVGGDNPKKSIDTSSKITVKKSTSNVDARTHYTNIVLGNNRLSKAWETLKNINGEQTKVFADSLVDVTAAATRSATQTFEFGFNQKGFWFDQNFMWSRSDLISVIPGIQDWLSRSDDPTFLTKESGTVLAYAGWVKNMTELMIENSNKYFPVTIKIHLCCLKNANVLYRSEDASQSSSDQNIGRLERVSTMLARRVFPQYNVDDNRPASAVPQGYYYPNADYDSGEGFLKVLFDTDTSLKKSSFFRENVSVVRTDTKVIKPSDTWVYKYQVNHPGGIKLNTWIDQSRESESSVINFSDEFPMDYFPIIEVVGRRCETIATPVNNASARYLGTSPGALFCEYKKTCCFINSPVVTQDFTQTAASDNLQAVVMAIRLLLTNTTKADATNKKFNFNFSQLTSDPTATSGNYIIPVTTDLDIKYAGENISG